MKYEVTVFFERGEDGWWIASAPEIPGAHSLFRPIDEVREMLLDAIKELTLAPT